MSAEASALSPSAEFRCSLCGAQLDRLHLEADGVSRRCTFCGAPQEAATNGLPAVSRRRQATSVGETLRDARMVRGESLEQAARYTNIRVPYLRDLEQGATGSFEPYPGRVYARFFLREYADHLGLDAEPLVRGFDDGAEPAVAEITPMPAPKRPPSQRRWAVGAAVVLVTMLAVGALLARRDAPPVAPLGAAVGGPSIAVYPHGRDRPPPTSPGAPIAAVVTVTRDCWVLAVVDGSTVLQETVPAGETLRIDATRTLDLRFGDAGAANLRVNGRRFPAGADGQVADLSFALRGDRLVASP